MMSVDGREKLRQKKEELTEQLRLMEMDEEPEKVLEQAK